MADIVMKKLSYFASYILRCVTEIRVRIVNYDIHGIIIQADIHSYTIWQKTNPAHYSGTAQWQV